MQPTLLKAILAGQFVKKLDPQVIGISIQLFESIDTYDTAIKGFMRLPLEGEALLGFHAGGLVGYIDKDSPNNPTGGTGYFVFRNSWGKKWTAENSLGAPGYGLIPELFFTQPELFRRAYILLP